MKHILLTFAIWAGLFLAGAQAQVTLLDEAFEGNTLPLGWTTIDADGDGHQWEHSSVQGVFYQTHSGEGAAVSYAKLNGAALTPDDWLVSPPITLVGNSTLSFWRMVAFNNMNHYGVYISTTSATDPAAFTLLYEETPTSYAWTERTVNLDAYTGSTVYIAFRHFNTTNKIGIALDDVVLTSVITGPIITANPNMLQFPNVPMGQSSASQPVTVESFNIVGDVTASVALPFEISNNDTIFTNTLTFTPALQPLYVRYSPVYEGSDSAVLTLSNGTVSTDVVLFGNSVDCSNFTLPYEEDFNALLEYDLPNCWSRINPVDGAPMATNGITAGDKVLKFESDHINDRPVYAVLPLMPGFLTDLQISFTTMHETYSSGTFSVGYMTDPNDSSTFVSVWSVIPSQISAMEFHPFLVSFENAAVDPSQDHYIAFQYFSTQSSIWYVDDVVVDAISDCSPPYDLSVGMVTNSTATVYWSGNTSLYDIYYRPVNGTTWDTIEDVGIDPLGYTIENLLSSTAYEWYVASVCDGDTLVASLATSTFSTYCSPYGVPFEEDFDASTSLPLCWKRYSGWAGEVFAGEPLVSTTSGWNFMNTNVFGANHARVNIFGNTCRQWLVTPAIDLSGLSNPALVFNLALTAYASASPISDPTAQADDKFMVIVSTDFGNSWSAANATVWSNDGTGDHVFNQISATGEEITIPLADYVNDTVMIAFYAESTITGNGDNDLHIDNVTVNFVTNCPKPTNLAVQAVTDNSVTLSWMESGSATSWIIEYGPAGFQHGSSTATLLPVSTNPFTVGNLEPNAYDFYVEADCGTEVSYWSNVVSATPGVFAMGVSGSDTLTTCSMVICDNGGLEGNYSSGCYYTLVLYPETVGESVGVTGSYHTEANFDKLSIYDGVGTNGTLLGEFSGNGTIPVLIGSNGPITLRFISDSGIEYSGFSLSTFCSSCMPPGDLAVNNVGPQSADIAWSGSADAYLVEYKAVGDTAWTQGNTTDTVFSLTGLTVNTTYVVNVYSNCTDGQSLAATLTFTTTMAPTALPYSTDFSAGSDQSWLFDNGNCTNRWTIGNAGGNANGLFISSNGTTPGYNTSSRSVVAAEKLFVVGDAAEFTISFDVKIGGEDDFDYLKVFFAPSDVSYPANNTGASYPEYSNMDYNVNAVDFSDYMQYSAYSSYSYKYNLTGNNTVQVTVVMPNPNVAPSAASTAKLVFLWKNDQGGGTSPGAIIYNVSIEELSCPAPSGLTVSNLTSSGAHVAWTANGNETSWTVEYREAGASSWTSTPVSGIPSVDLTGLTVGTAYQLRLQANCDVDDNSLWVSTEFYTPCDAIATFPFTEGFENGDMPDCWSQEHVFGLVDWSFQAGDHPNDSINSAHGGAYNAYFFDNSDASNTTRLVSPVFDLSNVSNPYLTYWYAQTAWGNNQDHLTILYRTSPSSDWQILSPHGQSVGLWTMDSVALPTPTATYQIAFSGEANYGYGIVLDDITINGVIDTTVVPEPCDAPTDLHQLIYVKETGAIHLTWTDNAGTSQWNLQYRPQNGDWTTVVVTGEPHYEISGLVNGEVYEVRVQAICDGGVVSEWSAILTATATNDGVDSWLENSVNLYPNPAKEVVNVQCTMHNVQSGGELHLFDVYGKLLQIVPISSETTQIDVSGLADGMYFVRVTTEEGAVTKTFVKR